MHSMKRLFLAMIMLVMLLPLINCGSDGNESSVNSTARGTAKYAVTYDATGANSGTVPKDPNEYPSGSNVTVLGNTGNLTKTGYVFSGWNTKADGTGTTFSPNETFQIFTNITLYAKWDYSPGALDTSFNPPIDVNEYVIPLKVQADGTIFILVWDDNENCFLEQLSSNGQQQYLFAIDDDNDTNTYISDLAIDNDGKILVAGGDESGNHYLKRLKADGSDDTTFTQGNLDESVNHILIQPDGKILISGNFTQFNGTPRNGIARIFP